jgi:hypothetical protein
MVAFVTSPEQVQLPDSMKVMMLLAALDRACSIIEADDALLSLFDPKYSGVPSDLAGLRAMLHDFRS